jgi:hypothetical protein
MPSFVLAARSRSIASREAGRIAATSLVPCHPGAFITSEPPTIVVPNIVVPKPACLVAAESAIVRAVESAIVAAKAAARVHGIFHTR